jgi:ubiquinone/menaquinone biosynthesis C-methylase UbiE/ketosteroid isomerase-like protein
MADAEISAFVREWNRALLERDLDAAAALRADGYWTALPGGERLGRAEELALLADAGAAFSRVEAGAIEVERDGGEATVRFESRIEGTFEGEAVDRAYRYTLSCRKGEDGWQALSARVEELGGAQEAPRRRGPSLRRLAGRVARRLGLRDPARKATLPKLAWIPYRPGEDFIVPPHEPDDPAADLPVPPESLWTDARYSAHGGKQVAAMLALVEASGLSFRDGDLILDLGCGPGRMIRHLRPVAGRCEIWGLDIDAEAILWCQRHLSPPFHFATTTKLPHLPFADGSVRFVYCGSLFTHIDDLADSWLLELRRILAPDGRLFLTLHDDRTVELLEEGRYARSDMARSLRDSPTFQAAKAAFAMFAIGRDSDSQVFYSRDWFERRIAPSFDILSTTDEAYYYQTGYVLAPKARR